MTPIDQPVIDQESSPISLSQCFETAASTEFLFDMTLSTAVAANGNREVKAPVPGNSKLGHYRKLVLFCAHQGTSKEQITAGVRKTPAFQDELLSSFQRAVAFPDLSNNHRL
jgi:hypothetical protein